MIRSLLAAAILLLAAPRDGRIEVAPGVELYYKEVGAGPPVVFIPGWTMTTEFFAAQLDAFSDGHRVVTFDPRSHGRSTKVAEGNTYVQHGRDLGVLLEALRLDGVVLVGWSSGVHDILAYVREHGTQRLRAVVLVDEPPKAVGDAEREWVWGGFEGYRSTFESILYRRRAGAEGLARFMVKRELDDRELQWIVEESLKTPAEAALSLMVDATLRDFTEEARALDRVVPVLYMVREEWAASARAWLSVNAPAAEVVTLGSHAEHWEHPDVFNGKLADFLARVPRRLATRVIR